MSTSALAPVAVATSTWRDVINTAGHALESGLVTTALDVLGIIPGGGAVALALRRGLPALGEALLAATAPELTLDELELSVLNMRRVQPASLDKP